jgi:hypothetical protein
VLTTALQLTPAVGLAGGAVLGICAVTKFLITGRILGISGRWGRLVYGCLVALCMWVLPSDWQRPTAKFKGGQCVVNQT